MDCPKLPELDQVVDDREQDDAEDVAKARVDTVLRCHTMTG